MRMTPKFILDPFVFWFAKFRRERGLHQPLKDKAQ